VEFLVIGESVAGVAAALEIASSGFPVRIVSSYDSAGLEDSFLIGPTALNAEPWRGTDFAVIAFDRLRDVHVKAWYSGDWFGSWDRVSFDPTTGDLVLDEVFEGERHRLRGVVFAPGGNEPGLPEETEAPFRWRGLSYSAWSDAPFFRGKPVAVIGCGPRAFDQALIAAEFAASVTVLCHESATEPMGLLAEAVASSGYLAVRTHAQIEALRGDEAGALSGVLVCEHGREALVAASGVFVAHDPVVDWEPWGGEQQALALRERGKRTFAGIAAGVPHSDHAALFESGVLAARECLTANR